MSLERNDAPSFEPWTHLEIPYMPTARQHAAWLLRTRRGLNDEAIARELRVHRVTANRLVNEFRRRINALRAFAPCDAQLVRKLTEGE